MADHVVGYEHLRQQLALKTLPASRVARVRSYVTKVTTLDEELAVPRSVAPINDSHLDHILFALKHEGTDLATLSQAVLHVDPAMLVTELRSKPTSSYLRQTAMLWELFNGKELMDAPAPYGPYVDLFDTARYVTGSSIKFPRWRVNWNGIGGPNYCATVELTDTIRAALDSDVLTRVREFSEGLADGLLKRTQEWAYLHETQSSFEIERESPNEDRARMFVRLLARAHERAELTEDYLAELQSATMRNPLDRAVGFRDRQNWLSGPRRGAASLTYIPPAPELARSLMDELMAFANGPAKEVPPLIAASILSFGFVFIHPFMDGNGRLSRFLFHHALCRSGQLGDGNLLPVSVAMQKNESQYLGALQSYSKATRDYWDVLWIDDDSYEMTFKGDASIYRYWNATTCVEFGLQMAEFALEQGLKAEAQFLGRYDVIRKRIEAEFDVRSSDLSPLIVMVLDNNGVVSGHRRKQFVNRVPAMLFDRLEQYAVESLRHVGSAPSP